MAPAILDRETALHGLRQRKAGLETRYGVTRLGVFGSVARNEARVDSDVDVVVELREPDLYAMIHIKDELETELGRPVDVVRYRAQMDMRLKARIDREAVYA